MLKIFFGKNEKSLITKMRFSSLNSLNCWSTIYSGAIIILLSLILIPKVYCKKIPLTWESQENIDYYLIEISKSQQVKKTESKILKANASNFIKLTPKLFEISKVVLIKTPYNFINISLTYGVYYIRVAAVSKKGIMGDFSDVKIIKIKLKKEKHQVNSGKNPIALLIRKAIKLGEKEKKLNEAINVLHKAKNHSKPEPTSKQHRKIDELIKKYTIVNNKKRDRKKTKGQPKSNGSDFKRWDYKRKWFVAD